MTPDQQIDRSVLAGKDRDELHTIAGAIGVKAATRMRKADLIDAILTAANGGEASADPDPDPQHAVAAKPRRVRSTRASQAAADDLATLAAEEDALAGDGSEGDVPVPRPRARRTASVPAPEPAPAEDRGPDTGTGSDSDASRDAGTESDLDPDDSDGEDGRGDS